MKIFHRIDDIQLYSDSIKEILDFFEKNTEEFILAVIPHKFDKRLARLIQEYRHCTVYQHGVMHRNRVKKGWCDEFPDTVAGEKCYKLIKGGKDNLEGILGYSISGYVPPWNNTSNQTIGILSTLGFKIYSAQDTNTVRYKMNKDITFDIVDKYTPSIVYKDLSEVYSKVKSMYDIKKEIGIMYHFHNINAVDWEKIKEFVRLLEKI